MGSPATEPGRTDIETQHPVTISRSFWMQTSEVTNSQFRALAQWAVENGLADISLESVPVLRDHGGNRDFLYAFGDEQEIGYDAAADSLVLQDGGHGLNPDNPVIGLPWWGAAAYCDWLSLRVGLAPAYDHDTWTVDLATAEGFRLPTEAEWEYAARGGRQTAFSGSRIQDAFCGPDSLRFQGWYCANARDWTRPVRQLLPNAYGLYDMHGNVWEFCNDWFDPDYYLISPQVDPPGPEAGDFRLGRGGAWGVSAGLCRSAKRGVNFPGMVSTREGFRPILPQGKE